MIDLYIISGLSAIALIVLWLSNYFDKRISNAYDLRVKVLNLCYEYDIKNNDKISSGEESRMRDKCFIKLPSYEKMVYSFKPLTLESYLSKEHLNKLL